MNNLKLFSPIITGYIFSILCNTSSNEGANLPQRPPAWVFGVVWPILYILLGYSWSIIPLDIVEVDYIYTLCIVLLNLWIYVYNCKKLKVYGIYIIACIIALLICLMTLHNHKLSKILLTPLLAWLLIAYLLNWNIISE